MKLYWKHRVWTEMHELFVNLDSVIRVLPSEQEQLLEAHRITVDEFERLKETLGDDFTVQYIRRARDVNLISVALDDKTVAGIVPAIDREER